MTVSVSESRWTQVSRFIEEHLGLHFSQDRWRDLERGLAAVARECQFASVEACLDWLLSAPLSKSRIEVLASQLTVGETYFFRERQTFQVLEERILPDLIGSRRGGDQRLRIWSAGCATGEEPYSIAIALDRLLPDARDWHITLLATDINPGFLEAASRGIYKAWSFRHAPPGLQQLYFRPLSDCRWEIRADLQRRVTFVYLNLAEDVYPSLLNNTNAMDIILCRNVLMYFSPERAGRVIRAFYRALVQGGWLIVSPAETSHVLFPDFVAVNFPEVILYRKTSTKEGAAPVVLRPEETVEDAFPRAAAWSPPLLAPAPMPLGYEQPSLAPLQVPEPGPPPPPGYTEALAQYEQGRYVEAAEILLNTVSAALPDPAAMALLARTYANQGRLEEALAWCERAIAADRLNPGWHYLHATILQEQDALSEAARSLNRALYLEPNFALAYFAQAHLALRQGQRSRARKFFDSALAVLRSCAPEQILPESEGITAGRLSEIIESARPRESTT